MNKLIIVLLIGLFTTCLYAEMKLHPIRMEEKFVQHITADKKKVVYVPSDEQQELQVCRDKSRGVEANRQPGKITIGVLQEEGSLEDFLNDDGVITH